MGDMRHVDRVLGSEAETVPDLAGDFVEDEQIVRESKAATVEENVGAFGVRAAWELKP